MEIADYRSMSFREYYRGITEDARKSLVSALRILRDYPLNVTLDSRQMQDEQRRNPDEEYPAVRIRISESNWDHVHEAVTRFKDEVLRDGDQFNYFKGGLVKGDEVLSALTEALISPIEGEFVTYFTFSYESRSHNFSPYEDLMKLTEIEVYSHSPHEIGSLEPHKYRDLIKQGYENRCDGLKIVRKRATS